MFENIKDKIIDHYNFDETQCSKFEMEEIDDDTFELTHPKLYHTVTAIFKSIAVGSIVFELIIGHYKYIPGIRYELDGTGEPDNYEPIDDFAHSDENIIIEMFLKLEDGHIQQEKLFGKYEQDKFDAMYS